ncbi:type II toxin-antitoxin system VapC family toxin [Deferrisoma camini]|uniref:type II toxin-antitoxin system VapC family toxin n=1 Tax=Deferrisoma camini TaxID=1035120 RepID=UPI0004A3AC3E|nr:type II toxin-antitoxin system VapC family toxin [Deferrisoma camini]
MNSVRAAGTSWVLDASTVLALLQEEPGANRVLDVLPRAAISTVNLSEVVGKLLDVGMPEVEISHVVGALGLETVPFGDETAWRAADLKLKTRGLGLSLGDRACLATGLVLGRPVLTADRAWTKLELPIRIECVR